MNTAANRYAALLSAPVVVALILAVVTGTLVYLGILGHGGDMVHYEWGVAPVMDGPRRSVETCQAHDRTSRYGPGPWRPRAYSGQTSCVQA